MNGLDWGVEFLKSRGVPEPEASAEFILAHVLGTSRSLAVLSGGRALTPGQARRFRQFISSRARRKPLAYILGSQPFLNFEMKVSPEVLIPRPETEELVMRTVQFLKREPLTLPSPQRGEGDEVRGNRDPELRIVELGAGSGCISIALASLLNDARIEAVEKSPAAILLARENARSNGVSKIVRFIQDDFLRPRWRPARKAGLLISNPPYVSKAALRGLEPEVLREPRSALDAGPDGLRHLRAIISGAGRYLAPDGWIALEIGFDQGRAVAGLLKSSGFERVRVETDMQGRPRMAFGRLNS
jgi:release factor glutamine methyltransferase